MLVAPAWARGLPEKVGHETDDRATISTPIWSGSARHNSYAVGQEKRITDWKNSRPFYQRRVFHGQPEAESRGRNPYYAHDALRSVTRFGCIHSRERQGSPRR